MDKRFAEYFVDKVLEKTKFYLVYHIYDADIFFISLYTDYDLARSKYHELTENPRILRFYADKKKDKVTYQLAGKKGEIGIRKINPFEN